MKQIPTLLGCLLVLLVSACKTSKLVKPMEQYEERAEDLVSNLNIPIKVSMKELEQSINKQLEGTIYEDSDIKDGDNMMVRAVKKEDIRLSVDSQAIKYKLPLGLWIMYDIGISNVEAEADISMDFKTEFKINEDWTIETITEIEDYTWLKKPKIRMAGVSVPVGGIASLVLRRSKTQIAKSIDDLVAQNLNLKELMEDAWKQMFKPFLVSEEYNTWLIVNPQQLGMTEMQLNADTLSSTVVVQSKPEVRLGLKPSERSVDPLPPFQYSEEAADNFEIHLRTEVTYEEAERLAKEQLLGETFSQGSRSVTIEGIELYGSGEELVVNTQLTGSYNGSVFMTGKPVYNRRKNAIDIKDLKFTLETKSFLIKSASWLLKSTIKKKIQENMDFLLDYNLTEMKNQFQEQLKEYKAAEGVLIKGNLEELNIENAYLTSESMKVDVALRGNLNVLVTGLALGTTK